LIPTRDCVLTKVNQLCGTQLGGGLGSFGGHREPPDGPDDNSEGGPLSSIGEADLATASYKSALEIAASLSRDEQLRLIQELTVRAAQASAPEQETSLLALCGLGQEIWRDMDAQEYVRRERSSWNG
jgi:hypothetical protein